MRSACISVKEIYALFILVKTVIYQNASLRILCDNACVVAAIRKSRSENSHMHAIIQRIRTALVDANAEINVLWVPTAIMAGEHLADQPSRGIFTRSNLSLSKSGADKFKSMFPNFAKSAKENNAVSLFSSPASNPFEIDYCSIDLDMDDKKCLKKCGFQAINYGLPKKYNSVFAFPSPGITSWFIQAVSHSDWIKKQDLYVLIHAEFLSIALIEFSNLGKIDKKVFAGKRNKGLFDTIPGSCFSAIKIQFD